MLQSFIEHPSLKYQNRCFSPPFGVEIAQVVHAAQASESGHNCLRLKALRFNSQTCNRKITVTHRYHK